METDIYQGISGPGKCNERGKQAEKGKKQVVLGMVCIQRSARPDSVGKVVSSNLTIPTF